MFKKRGSCGHFPRTYSALGSLSGASQILSPLILISRMGDEGWQPRPSTWGRSSRPVLKPLPRDTACPSCVQKITASHSHGTVCSCTSQREHAVKVHGGPKCLVFVWMAAPWNPGARPWPAPATPRRRQNGGRADLHILAWTVTLPCLRLALVYWPQGLWSLTDLRGQLPPPPPPPSRQRRDLLGPSASSPGAVDTVPRLHGELLLQRRSHLELDDTPAHITTVMVQTRIQNGLDFGFLLRARTSTRKISTFIKL